MKKILAVGPVVDIKMGAWDYTGPVDKGGRPHGYGTKSCDTEGYDGGWHHGLRHGLGEHWTRTDSGYCSVKGTWNLGQIKSDVEYQIFIGDVCQLTYKGGWEGDLFAGLPHGQGQMCRIQGVKYEGEFVHGKKQGTGEMLYSNGTIYKGSFLNNLPHGNGVIKAEDGRNFSGLFSYGKPNKTGVHPSRPESPRGCELRPGFESALRGSSVFNQSRL
ncbi:MAG: hypothetical protein CL521_01535 [Actinobacteria bacterium]|nr:hypothetical protein [Actinomycetota bacterium]